MAPDVKSSSWQKTAPAPVVRNSSLTGSSRRRLSEAFDKEKKPKGAASKTGSPSGPLREMRQFSVGRFKIPNVRTSPTRRVLRSGADKITRTLQQLRISVDNFSQVWERAHKLWLWIGIYLDLMTETDWTGAPTQAAGQRGHPCWHSADPQSEDSRTDADKDVQPVCHRHTQRRTRLTVSTIRHA